MPELSHKTEITNFLAQQELNTVHDVSVSMLELQSMLGKAGRATLDDFHGTYRTVTSNISDILDARNTLGVDYFTEPEVLNYATSTFYPLYTENILQPKKHWSWIEDERTPHVDSATRGILGYISHIGGDLSLTVHTLAQSERFSPLQIRNYLRHDYSLKIDRVLWRTAHQMSPVLTDIDNEHARRSLTNGFMLGVIVGRQIALADSRKMAKAKSEDQIESILERSRSQTDKLAKKVLSLSVDINTWLNQERTEQTGTGVSDISLSRKTNASKRLASIVNAGLKRAA